MIIIDRSGPNGNAFAIMGFVKKHLEDMGRGHIWPNTQKKMMEMDYDALCRHATFITRNMIKFVN